VGEGVEGLRAARGSERVTFDNVCDHLTDYVERNPGDARAIEALARFLAEVENVDHDHERDPRRGLG